MSFVDVLSFKKGTQSYCLNIVLNLGVLNFSCKFRTNYNMLMLILTEIYRFRCANVCTLLRKIEGLVCNNIKKFTITL